MTGGCGGADRRWLAVDWGERRVGLAVSDPSGTVASPAGHLVRRPGKRPPVAELARRVADAGATAIIMGLPLDANGDETARCGEVRAVGAALGARTGLPVRYVDERFTTAAALRAIREQGGTTRGRRGDVDALAAVVLLQHALKLPDEAGGGDAVAAGNRQCGGTERAVPGGAIRGDED